MNDNIKRTKKKEACAESCESFDACDTGRIAAAIREQGMGKDHAHQPPSAPVGVAEAWQQGYHQGVQDERTSDANIGIAGFGAKVEPARNNPYLSQQPAADRDIEADALQYVFGNIDRRGWAQIVDEQMTPPWPLMHHAIAMGLFKQPAAVDDAMVERACQHWYTQWDEADQATQMLWAKAMRDLLTAALDPTAAPRSGVGLNC